MNYFNANSPRGSASIKPVERDFHGHRVELQNTGVPQTLMLASFIALCSAALVKPVQSQLAIAGGTIVLVCNLAESMQVAFDASTKSVAIGCRSGPVAHPGLSTMTQTRTFLHKGLHGKNLRKLLISNNSHLRFVIVSYAFCTMQFFIERARCSDPAFWEVPAGSAISLNQPKQKCNHIFIDVQKRQTCILNADLANKFYR